MEEVYKKTVNENGIYSCNEIDISVEEWKLVLQNEKINGNLYYPDFYKGIQLSENSSKEELEKISETNFILYAEYKHLENRNQKDEWINSFSRDDLHQLVTYLHILPAKKGALVYPFDKTESTDEKIVKGTEKNLFGLGGTIYTLGFTIPSAENYEEFKKN